MHAGTVDATSPAISDAISGLRREWRRDFEDFSDSMKAGQMEVIRLAEENRRLSAPVDLAEILPSELIKHLTDATRQHLEAAQAASCSRDTQIRHLAAPSFCLAYELEFNTHLRHPLLERIAKECGGDYPADGNHKLFKNGSPVRNNTTGTILRFLREDSWVQELVRELGLNPEEVIATGNPIAQTRNDILHPSSRDPGVLLDRIRALILGNSGRAFRALISSKQG